MASRLLEGDEAGGMGSPDAGPAVFHGLVGDGELAQVVADHLRLAFHLVEGLAVVDAHHAAHRLGQNDHVAQVRLHTSGFSMGGASFWALRSRFSSECCSLRRRGSAAGAGAHCIAASVAHRTCPAAGQGLRRGR